MPELTAEEIRERVLRLWDQNGAWIPGVAYARLAYALGVPAERTLTHRHGGQSRPGPVVVPTRYRQND